MSAPLRVAMYADAYEDYVSALAGALSRECDLRVLRPAAWSTRAGRERDFADVGGALVALPRVRDPRRLAVTAAAVRSVRRGTDVLHIQQSGDPWFSLAMMRPGRHLPLVVTIHDASPHPGDTSQLVGANALQRAWSRRVDRFIVHAPTVAEDLSRLWRVSPTRIQVIDHVELGSLYRSRTVGAPPVGREPATVLFFGRRYAYKGLAVLVEAIRRLAGVVPELRLIIAGVGDPLPIACATLPSEVTVEVHDCRVDDHTTIALFDRATVTCLPYLEASQSGVAALSIGLGTPLVASAIGGLPRLIRDGEQGLLVPPADPGALAEALAVVLGSRQTQMAMRSACLTRAATDLSAEHLAAETVEAYRTVVRR